MTTSAEAAKASAARHAVLSLTPEQERQFSSDKTKTSSEDLAFMEGETLSSYLRYLRMMHKRPRARILDHTDCLPKHLA
jgi:hypothetical protein